MTSSRKQMDRPVELVTDESVYDQSLSHDTKRLTILLTVFPKDHSVLLLLLVIAIVDICCSYLSPYLLRKWQVCHCWPSKRRRQSSWHCLRFLSEGAQETAHSLQNCCVQFFFSLSCWCRPLLTLEYENSRGQIWRSRRRLISGWPNTISLRMVQQLP